MFFVDRMAAVLKPTDVFLAWLQQYDEDFADLTLAQLRANCSVFPSLPSPNMTTQKKHYQS